MKIITAQIVHNDPQILLTESPDECAHYAMRDRHKTLRMLTDGTKAYISEGTDGASHDQMRTLLALSPDFERSVVMYNQDKTVDAIEANPSTKTLQFLQNKEGKTNE